MGEGFSNSVVGGTTLVRPAIKSPNFLTAISGWSINKDGSAEFNNVSVRGPIISGTGGSKIEILSGADIPAELQFFYSNNVTTCIQFWVDANFYGYIVTITGGGIALGNVSVAGPTVVENVVFFQFGSAGFMQMGRLSPSVLEFGGAFGNFASIRGTMVTENQNATDAALTANVLGDTANRFFFTAQGVHQWGDGTNPPDCIWFRNAAKEFVSDSIKWNNASTAETWHAVTLQNGFTNRGVGFDPLEYRMNASPANEVEVMGQIISGATVASGTIIGNLPAPYRPSTNQQMDIVLNGTSFAPLALILTTAGDLKLFGTWANGQLIQINAHLPLDA